MPAVIGPCTALKAFDITFYNGIGTTTFINTNSNTASVPFPAGFTFTTPPKIISSITKY
jgi:hypothetical protein